MQKTFYDLLGVSPRATTNEIKAAFRKKAQMVHPDKIQAQIANLEPYAAERLKKALEEDFRDLKEAYDVLSDTRQRREYDDLLKQIQATSAPPPPTASSSQTSSQQSAPASSNYCTVCGATLVGNSCPDCAKQKSSGVAVSVAAAFFLVIGGVGGVFVAVQVPQENSWDSDTCVGILVVIGIAIFVAMQKGFWGGIKRVRKTRPVLLAFVGEAFALVVLSLVVGAHNPAPKAASIPTKTASLALTAAAVKPADCRQMTVAHNVDIGPHTYSVGRLVCVTGYTNGKYFSPQDNAWFNESDLAAVVPASQAVPAKSAAHALTGQFGGTVKNETVGVSADFGISVKDDGGSLSGCMVVKPPLFGSGPLSGTINGSDVNFIVLSSIGGISFKGQRDNSALHGTYTVRHLTGSPDEIGTFALQKFGSGLAEFDFNAACSRVQPQVALTALAKSQQAQSAVLAKIPLHWRYVGTNNPVEVWLDERTFNEKATMQSTKPGAAVKMETSCAVPRGDSFPWAGSCTYAYFWSDDSGVFKSEPTCTVTTVEKITVISTTAISGQSQKVDLTPLQATPSKCPVAGTLYSEFALVPGLIAKSDQAASDKQATTQAPCSEMVIVKSNSYGGFNNPYPTSYSTEPISSATYTVGNRVTVTTKRNGRYFHPTFGGDGEWFSASDLRCPEKP
jgi:hypothetical protein